MRKFLAMIMALAMILSLATGVFAANGYTITINSDKAGHTYEAYQIFTGTIIDNTDDDNDDQPGTNAVLTNIQWGEGVDHSKVTDTAEEVAMKLSSGELTAQGLIEMVNNGTLTLTNPTGTSVHKPNNNLYEIQNLPAGYYLIKDKDDSLSGANAYTEFILEVLEDSTVNPKGSVPEVEKKIKDINDSEETDIDEKVWQDSADHDVGDIIPYKLEATLADNLEKYENGYDIVFHDYMSVGLTYKAISSVKIVNSENDVITLNAGQYTVKYENVSDIEGTELVEHSKLTVSIDSIAGKGGKDGCKVIVEYTAQLNENAVVGSLGNPNEVYLTFSRNPYEDNDYGETPRDRVIAFTYKVVVNKVREDGVDDKNKPVYAPLSGATFTLEKWYKTGVDENGKETGAWQMLKTVETKPDTTFTFSGLDDGWYRLTETKAPNGYNEIDPIYFNVNAAHDEESDDPELTMLTATETKETGDTLGEGDLGTFEIVHDEEANALTTSIVNRAGVVLPETGGIGTTIFYVAGALMVLCAVILLITKKRMNVAE